MANELKKTDWLAVVASGVMAAILAVLVFQIGSTSLVGASILAGVWAGITGILGFHCGDQEWHASAFLEGAVAAIVGAIGGLLFAFPG